MLRKWFLYVALMTTFLAPVQMVQAQNGTPDPLVEELTKAAIQHRSRLNYDGIKFSGPAWGKLLAEGKAAQFFLLGEEHGIAENPKLAAALYAELAVSGYERLVIEISPTMATKLDGALREAGLDGLRDLYSKPGGKPAFSGCRKRRKCLRRCGRYLQM